MNVVVAGPFVVDRGFFVVDDGRFGVVDGGCVGHHVIEVGAEVVVATSSSAEETEKNERKSLLRFKKLIYFDD